MYIFRETPARVLRSRKQADSSILERLISVDSLHSDYETLVPARMKLGYLSRQALQDYQRRGELGDNPQMAQWGLVRLGY